MYEQINSQFAGITKQFTDAALKANTLAFQNFERVLGLQLKTIEDRVNANVAFFSEAAEVRDFDGFRSIWPKGLNLLKETTEQVYGANQEAFTQTMKTSEAISQIAKANFESAQEDLAKATQKTAKNAAK